MSLLINPRILDHNWFGLESRLFLLGEKSGPTSLLSFVSEFILGSPHQLGGCSHSLPWVRGLSNRELLHRLSMIIKKKFVTKLSFNSNLLNHLIQIQKLSQNGKKRLKIGSSNQLTSWPRVSPGFHSTSAHTGC